jgi:hypothetical protein
MIILAVIGIFILMAILRGFVLTYLWDWFVVPLGVTDIGAAHALGIALLLGWITREGAVTKYDQNPDKGEAFIEAISGGVSVTLVAWGLGWIFHACM